MANMTDEEKESLTRALDSMRLGHAALERLSDAQLAADHKQSLLERSAFTIRTMETLLQDKVNPPEAPR